MEMRQKGYSLVELMVVVIVVAILGMIGLPSYRAYMIRSQRTEAKDALVRLASNQEKFYFQNRTYSADLAELGFTAGGLTDTGLYQLALVADQLSWSATAVPAAGSGMTADEECQEFGVDETGLRTADPDPRNRCW